MQSNENTKVALLYWLVTIGLITNIYQKLFKKCAVFLIKSNIGVVAKPKLYIKFSFSSIWIIICLSIHKMTTLHSVRQYLLHIEHKAIQ